MNAWKQVDRLPGRDDRLFRFRKDVYRSPQGVDYPFVVLEAPDWVNGVALTSELQVVVTRQYRHGVREETVEFPGGMTDEGE